MPTVLDLPELPLEYGTMPVDARRSPVVDITTPGSIQPSKKQTRGSDASIGTTTTMSSASHLNSNGQFQQKNLNAGDNGVTKTQSSAPLKSSNGQVQFKDLHAIDQGTLTEGGGGLPKNVMADKQNFTKTIVGVAESKPIATEAMPDRGSPKRVGVPTSVTIK